MADIITYCPDRSAGTENECSNPEACREARVCAKFGNVVRGFITPEGAKVRTPSHAAQFAVELIGKHETRTTGMIWVAFVNQLGNHVDGEGIEAQKATLRTLLAADDRLAYNEANDSWTDLTETAGDSA